MDDDTAIPTLHTGPTPIISTKGDKVAYIIRHAILNPGWTSSFFESQLVSFRKLNSQYGSDGEVLATNFKNQLYSVLIRFYPETEINVEIEYVDIDGSKYELNIVVTDSGDNPIIVSGKVTIDENNVPHISFDGEENHI